MGLPPFTTTAPSLTSPGLFSPPRPPHPPQDSAPLGDGPTLSLSNITFSSAGTYTCEAYMPTVPLLSRNRTLKLLVEGSG